MAGLQPSIEIFGLRIDEPMTAGTDVLVAVVCFYAFYKLYQIRTPERSHLYFRLYFLLLGLGTLFGGVIGHGFIYALGFGWKLPGWILSMLSVAMIERSSIAHARSIIKPNVARFFLILNVVELITIMTITMVGLKFKWVEIHSGYGLLGIVLPFHAYVYYRTRNKGSLIVIRAVGIACVAALVFMNKISPHLWFNHMDLSHIIMMIAAYMFYRGALQLGDLKQNVPPEIRQHMENSVQG